MSQIPETQKELLNRAAAPVVEKEKQGDMLGHNAGGIVAGARLVQYIERIERLEEEKAGLAEDIRDVYSESKSAGFDTKIIRQIIKLRKMDRQKRIEQQELLDLYASAIGMD